MAWLKKQLDEQQPKARKIREVSGDAMKARGIIGSGGMGVQPALGI